jgi:hypothetical protein
VIIDIKTRVLELAIQWQVAAMTMKQLSRVSGELGHPAFALQSAVVSVLSTLAAGSRTLRLFYLGHTCCWQQHIASVYLHLLLAAARCVCLSTLAAGSSTLRLFSIVSHSSHLFAQRFSVPPRHCAGLSVTVHTQRLSICVHGPPMLPVREAPAHLLAGMRDPLMQTDGWL